MLYTGIILSFDIRCCLQAYVLLPKQKKDWYFPSHSRGMRKGSIYCMFHLCDFVSLHFGLHQM